MLDFIRSNTQSWIVKILFGIIILVFVFWGIGNIVSSPEIEVLNVNGQIITIQEFQKRCFEIQQAIRQNKPDISEEELKNANIKQVAIQQLIAETLLLQEAERIGLTATPPELRKVIEALPIFHNEQGKFDPQTYLQVLEKQGVSPHDFENKLKRSIIITKLQHELTSGIYLSTKEAHDVYTYETALRSIKYILFPVESYFDKVKISSEEVAKAYEESTEDFKIPTEVNLEYLLITPQSLAQNQKIDDTEITTYYEKNIEKYTHPEQVHAQHIIIAAPENASQEIQDAAKEKIEEVELILKKEKNFEKIAQKYSQDTFAKNGGDIGWFSYDQVIPAFAETAFALKPGQISKPIKTPLGYHLIKVIEKRPAGTIPLKDVKNSIYQLLAENKASGKLQDVLEQVQARLISEKDLQTAGKNYDLVPATTGLIPAVTAAKQLELNDSKEMSTILSTPSNTIINTPFITKNGYVFVHIKEIKQESIKPLEVVESELTFRIKKEKAALLAFKEAEETLPQLKDATIPKELEKYTYTSSPLMRLIPIEDLKNPKLLPAIFKAQPGTWLTEPYIVNQGTALVYVLNNVTYTSNEQWEKVKDTFMISVIKAKREQMFRGFLAILEKQAKLTVNNELILKIQ